MSALPDSIPITVGFHTGNVIEFLSHLYGNGFAVIREAVQNSIDEDATSIFVDIDCHRHSIHVYDNGNGASPQEITTKFENIGLSLKKDLPGKIGSKGIGIIAGLAIAERWQFVTRKLNIGPFYSFTFDRKELKKANEVQVNQEQLLIKQIKPSPITATSMLRLFDVSDLILKQLRDQRTIEQTLQEAFNSKLRSQKIELRVSYRDFKNKTHDFKVKPITYRGAKMESVEYDTPYGTVNFAFFHSPIPIDKPSILVQHQGVTSIPLGNFFKMKILPANLEHIFARGYFEGEVQLGFCTINGSRSAFIPDKQLDEFTERVAAFAEDVISPLIEQFEKSDREERLKRIADGVLKKTREFFSRYPDAIPPMFRSIISKPTTRIAPEGDAQVVNTSVIKPTKGVREKKPLDPDILREKKKESEEKRRTGTASVEKGSKAEIVEIVEGLGMHFVYPDPETDGFKWHSRISPQRILQINIANTDFLEAEKRGRTFLERYLTLLLQKEMTCVSLGDYDSQTFDVGFELMLDQFWGLSLQD